MLMQFFNYEQKESATVSRRKINTEEETERVSSPINMAPHTPREVDLPTEHGMTHVVEDVLRPSEDQRLTLALNEVVEEEA